jgi:hypothetical protein
MPILSPTSIITNFVSIPSSVTTTALTNPLPTATFTSSPDINASSTSTVTDSPSWQKVTIINCVIIFIVILLVCWLCHALSKHKAARRRLYLLAKESEPELTFTLWKERRLHAAELAAADLEFKKHKEREQRRENKNKGKKTKKIFGFKPAIQAGDGIPIPPRMFLQSTAPRPEDEENLAGDEPRVDVGVALPMPPLKRMPTWGSEAPPAYEPVLMENQVCWWDALVQRIT